MLSFSFSKSPPSVFLPRFLLIALLVLKVFIWFSRVIRLVWFWIFNLKILIVLFLHLMFYVIMKNIFKPLNFPLSIVLAMFLKFWHVTFLLYLKSGQCSLPSFSHCPMLTGNCAKWTVTNRIRVCAFMDFTVCWDAQAISKPRSKEFSDFLKCQEEKNCRVLNVLRMSLWRWNI